MMLVLVFFISKRYTLNFPLEMNYLGLVVQSIKVNWGFLVLIKKNHAESSVKFSYFYIERLNLKRI